MSRNRVSFTNDYHTISTRCNENTSNPIEVCLYNLSLYENIIEIIFIINICLLIFYILSKKLKVNFIESNFIFFYHILFTVAYIKITLNAFRVDPVSNYLWSLTNPTDYLPGKDFIEYIVHIFGFHLSLSYYSVSIIFGLFGSIGFLIFYSLIKKQLNNNLIISKIILILFFMLPSFHLWTSGIGKDSLIFLSLSLAYFWMNTKNKNIIFLGLILFLIFMIRPHLAIILAPSLVLFLLILKTTPKIIKLSLLILSSLYIVYALPVGLAYIGISVENIFEVFTNETYNKVKSIIAHRQNLNISYSAGVNIGNLNFIEKILTYLFRPHLLEARGFTQFVVSIENLFLILLTLSLIFYRIKKINFNIEFKNYFLLIYIIIFLVMLSFNTANFGISSRQKWMILPYLFIILSFVPFYKKND